MERRPSKGEGMPALCYREHLAQSHSRPGAEQGGIAPRRLSHCLVLGGGQEDSGVQPGLLCREFRCSFLVNLDNFHFFQNKLFLITQSLTNNFDLEILLNCTN